MKIQYKYLIGAIILAILGIVFFKSRMKAEGFDASSLFTGLSGRQASVILQLTSLFENFNPELQFGYAENIGDGRGVTFGFVGFTSGTCDGSMIIKEYERIKGNNNLSRYIPVLDSIDREGCFSSNTNGLDGFENAIREAANDPLFIQAQLNTADKLYITPSQKKADEFGFKFAITRGELYDAYINHGESGAIDIMNQIGASTSDERAWLAEFLEIRANILLADSTWVEAIDRVRVYQKLLSDGNVNLDTPVSVYVYGSNFTLNPEDTGGAPEPQPQPKPVGETGNPVNHYDYIGRVYKLKYPEGCVYKDGVKNCGESGVLFEVLDAGNGKVRLHNTFSSKKECLYIEKGTYIMKSWSCWEDPGMEFKILKTSDNRLRLQHQGTLGCLKPYGDKVYGEACNSGEVSVDVELEEVSIPETILDSSRFLGKKYRIKFEENKCMYPNNIWKCWEDNNMEFKLVKASNNKVRVHHILSGKCMYIEGGTLSMKSWNCWSDPNMEFNILGSEGGKLKLQHNNSGKCLGPKKSENGSEMVGYACTNKKAVLELVQI